MKERFKTIDIDSVASTFMMLLALVFVDRLRYSPMFLVPVSMLAVGFYLADSTRKGFIIRLPWRMLITVAGLWLAWVCGVFKQSRASALVFFYLLVLFFSTAPDRWGRCLRILCGLFAGVVLVGFLPPVWGLPLSLLIIMLAISSLISAWSGMRLVPSLVWFSKRSIRKETIFLIVFLAGITAIGLRQAQEYASRQSGLSGLSRFITPGSMQHLRLSSALAMRIQFASKPALSQSELYLRGEVMDQVKGFNWNPGPSRLVKGREPLVSDMVYDVSLNARYSDFVPLLEYGIAAETGVSNKQRFSVRDNGVFQAMSHEGGWAYFRAYSRLTPVDSLADEDIPRLLQVPERIDPRVARLAKDLAHEGDVDYFVSEIAKFFKREGFEYTLQPRYSGPDVADFLFNSKQGYCEHYAAASALLARQGGIPSRVIAGFLGGQWDSSGTTLYVRDFDAHAWVELWDKSRRVWRRVDPVSFVAPDRVQEGAEMYLRSQGVRIPDFGSIKSSILFANILMGLDQLLAFLGGQSIITAGGVMIDYGEELSLLGTTGLLFSYLTLRIRRYRRERQTAELMMLRNLNDTLSVIGQARGPGETVDLWLRRVAGRFHLLENSAKKFSDSYGRYRYSRNRSAQELLVMEKAIREMKGLIRQIQRDPTFNVNRYGTQY